MARPTPAPARAVPGRARLTAVLVVVLVGLALVAGCAAFDVFADLQGDLEDAGFSDVSANIAPADASVVVISASAPRDTSVDAAQDQAAEVVWTRFPRRFERLRVTIDDDREEWTYAELEDDLGARPDDLDTSTEIGDDLARTGLVVVLGVVAAGVVAVALVGLVVVLVVRSNRRRAATGPRPQPWMPPSVSAPGPHGAAAPVPPSGGWAPASAPPGPPTERTTPAASIGSTARTEQAVPPTPGAPPPRSAGGRRPRDPDARRLGRRPRGPTPDQAHTPPGWG